MKKIIITSTKLDGLKIKLINDKEILFNINIKIKITKILIIILIDEIKSDFE